jgi:hypothetical protein
MTSLNQDRTFRGHQKVRGKYGSSQLVGGAIFASYHLHLTRDVEAGEEQHRGQYEGNEKEHQTGNSSLAR